MWDFWFWFQCLQQELHWTTVSLVCPHSSSTLIQNGRSVPPPRCFCLFLQLLLLYLIFDHVSKYMDYFDCVWGPLRLSWPPTGVSAGSQIVLTGFWCVSGHQAVTDHRQTAGKFPSNNWTSSLKKKKPDHSEISHQSSLSPVSMQNWFGTSVNRFKLSFKPVRN